MDKQEKQKNILIVDDEPNNLAILKQVLQDDYQLSFARNGEKALEVATASKPDLILLDVMMPKMDGHEVCKRLKGDKKLSSIPVIFVTAMADAEDEAKGFLLGAVDYITKPISPPTVKMRVRTHLSLVNIAELEASQRAAIFMLGDAGHYNDTDTGVHIWRMSAYSSIIAKAAGWSHYQLDKIEKAAAMHDTGKIGIPDNVLKAPRKLTAEEWVIMKTHSKIGHKILSKGGTPLFDLAAEIALSHHEKWDGSGYPDGLAGKDIPESARIIAIADVFDALTMKRPYKEPWSIEDSIAEIKNSAGNHFDPYLVELFVKVVPEILKAKDMWKDR